MSVSLWREAEFRKRALSALLLAPLVLAAAYFLPFWPFLWLWTAVVMGAAYEWSRLCGLERLPQRLIYLALLAGLIALALLWPRIVAWFYFHFGWSFLEGAAFWLDHAVWPFALFWLLFALFLRRNPSWLRHHPPGRGGKILLSLFVLFGGWLMVARLRANFGELALLYLLGLVWTADISAYLVGKRWGTAKLAPEISPGKTVEGLLGALLGSALYALLCGIGYHIRGLFLADFVLLALVATLVSVAGDLLVSLYKRWAGVKESGHLIPGHGGLLDRIDSLLAAAPILYAAFFLRILLW